MPRERKYNSNKPGYEAVREYRESNQIKRVPLDLKLSDYEDLKQAASAAGLSVNGYIKQAIKAAIAADGIQAAPEGEALPGQDAGLPSSAPEK